MSYAVRLGLVLALLAARVASADAGVTLSTANRWREEFAIQNVEVRRVEAQIEQLMWEVRELEIELYDDWSKL